MNGLSVLPALSLDPGEHAAGAPPAQANAGAVGDVPAQVARARTATRVRRRDLFRLIRTTFGISIVITGVCAILSLLWAF